jgi:hypothetical protein
VPTVPCPDVIFHGKQGRVARGLKSVPADFKDLCIKYIKDIPATYSQELLRCTKECRQALMAAVKEAAQGGA